MWFRGTTQALQAWLKPWVYFARHTPKSTHIHDVKQ